MKKIVLKIMSICASAAFVVAMASNMTTASWLYHQPVVPQAVKAKK